MLQEAEPWSSTAGGLTFFKFVHTRLALERQKKKGSNRWVRSTTNQEGREERKEIIRATVN